ncbi:MAG: hypothetical protein Kow0063_37510 [Anaerolineae bacterium]
MMDQAPRPHPSTSPISLPILTRWLLLGGLLLAALGASFAPWVDRPAAALVLTAPDLAEFVKFLPEVRDGSLKVQRLLFLLPLFAATFSLPLVISARSLVYPRLVRQSVLVLVIPLSLTLLPPVWSPGVLLSPEFRLQTAGCLLCLGLGGVSRWLRKIALRPVLLFLALTWLSAPILALWQFRLAQEAIRRVYASPVAPGWGAWATFLGFILASLAALLTAKSDRFLQLVPGNCVVDYASSHKATREGTTQKGTRR